MSPISEILTPERSPAVEAQLIAARQREGVSPSTREFLIEAGFAVSFLVVALAIGLDSTEPRDFPWASALVLVAAGVMSSRVVFSVGSTYTIPIQLAFVPMLFVTPVAWAPILIATALLASSLIDVVIGKTPAAKLPSALSNCWFAVPSTLVLLAAGSPGAAAVSPGVVIAALAAQLLGDFLVSSLREWLHTGATLREQVLEGAYVYLVDALLAPVGFLIALGADAREWVVGFPFALLAMLGLFSREREQRMDSLVELNDAYRGTALVLGDVIEFDDAYTGVHTTGVVDMARRVAELMGVDAGAQRNVEFGALLHDVGKIAVPKEIINKPGPLTDEEWEIIKTHTVEGERMLERIGGLMADIGRIVRSAHERWDGHGYPDGLAGEQIPIESRIIFGCDAFNAMTTDRSYRPGRSASEALAELQANAGTQFDPRVVEAIAEIVAARQLV